MKKPDEQSAPAANHRPHLSDPMKRIVLTLLLALAAVPAAGQNKDTLPQGTLEAEFRRNSAWVFERIPDLSTEYFVYMETDRLAITVVTNRVRSTASGADVWTAWYYKEPQRSRYGTYTYEKVLERVVVNCGTRKWATMRSIAYLDSRVVDEYESPAISPRMEETIPNSVGEAVVDNICDYLRRRR
ncbi:MAG TPA: surface-adhesin E family protein [Longimicrobiaceae bacterium]